MKQLDQFYSGNTQLDTDDPTGLHRQRNYFFACHQKTHLTKEYLVKVYNDILGNNKRRQTQLQYKHVTQKRTW